MTRPTPPESASRPLRDGSLTLRLLGEPCLCGPGEAGSERRVLGVGKPLALLTYLAVSPQHEATRDFLADLLWGGDSVSDPAHSLRNALVSLKNVVGHDVVEASASRCRLRRAFPSDLDALEAAIRDGRLAEVTERYTGEFFAGFAAPGCQQFELWCESVRHRLRTDVANAADVLARRLLDAGRARDAVQLARRIAEIEPFGQRARRILLESLIAAGDDLGALTEAAVIEQWLRMEDFDAEPATKALLAQARRGRSTGRRSSGETRSPLTPDLVGREAEFADIVAAWDRARSRGPVFVAVAAGAGVGKSRLLADAANRLRAERGRVVEVRALPGERDLPFVLLAALVATLAPLVEASSISKSAARVLASLDPSLADRYGVTPDAGAGDQLLRRAFALRELLEAIAERKSTAIFLDDMHWADDASVDAILAALTRLPDARVLIVTASRPGVRHPLPPERTGTIALHPLSTDQLGQLVASIRPLPNTRWATEVSRCLQAASGGVPLFAILALRSAEDAGLLVAGETEWECPDPAALVGHLTQGTVLSQSLRDISPRAARILALLALAGRSVPVSFLRAPAAESPTDPHGNALSDLERRALIIRHGDACSISHDLVTDAALAALSDADRVRWSRALGAAMLATDEPPWVERGARLLADVEPAEDLARRLTPVLRTLRVASGVSMSRLIASWLGQSAHHQATAAAVARRLPVTVRLRPFRRRLLAAGIFGSGALLIGAWRAANPAPQPDAELRVFVPGPGTERRVVEVPLHRDGWNASAPLPVTIRSEENGVTGEARLREGSLISLAVHSGLRVQVFSDSGGSDVVRVDADGRRTRLTSAVGDDVPSSWSPDGRFVAMTSSRWSPARHHHLAILDLASGQVRPIGSGRGFEMTVRWSPDGSRLAFVRKYLDERLPELCTVDVDGRDEHCRPGQFTDGVLVLGWLDDAHLLVNRSQSDDKSVVASLAVDGPGSEQVIATSAWAPTLSPNGRWIAWQMAASGHSDIRVAPTADLTRSRVVADERLGTAVSTLGWSTRGLGAPYVAALRFDAPTDTLFVGVPHRAPVLALWSNGDRAPARRLRWSVDDSTTARVDTLGTIVANREGPVTVAVTTGGWRTARHTFIAVARRDRVVLREAWASGTSRWRLFGDPHPRIVDDTFGRALSNEGEGTYYSGAYLGQLLHARHGLAVDAIVRTPVTELQWQSLLLGLNAANDTIALSKWDHRSGYPPALSTTTGLGSCIMQYPSAEGVNGLRSVLATPFPNASVDFDARRLAHGAPWHLRLQVFPDGRCGVALDGRPLAISSERFERGMPMLLMTYGSSWRSRMLLGPVTISEGVPGDIDWTILGDNPRRTTPRSPR
ncbi:MAG TPA: AAA family ATPase [Gemmatimonadaceae bacterium]|jgi:DNA-binding SARP family transcriptional activator